MARLTTVEERLNWLRIGVFALCWTGTGILKPTPFDGTNPKDIGRLTDQEQTNCGRGNTMPRIISERRPSTEPGADG